MEGFVSYIPIDRRHALAQGDADVLPESGRGAALFADISGFTPLTETLVRELGPRRGADELTRQLNRVYDALISEVHAYHGCVITFSGDAITCWFDAAGVDERQAALRATACALAMQSRMRDFARVQTPSGGTVALAMKAAVAAGPIRRYLIGDPKIQRLDVLAGATLERMAAAEGQAEKGEVVLGSHALQLLQDVLDLAEQRIDPETGLVFARVQGLNVDVPTDPWPPLSTQTLARDEIRSWLLPPVYERLQTDQGRFLAELRPAVALFLRFGGLDYDNDDEAGRKLDAYIRWVQNVLARYESYLFQLTIGDKGCYLYAAFGAPLAHDDDAARAVVASLELRNTPAEMDYITGVQIGISQGRMRAGAYGGVARGTYGVLGDEVNIAARLMAKAGPSQVLVSESIVNSTAKLYHYHSLGPMQVKGKTEPITVYLAQDRRLPSPQRPASLYDHALVGRDTELIEMEAALEETLAGRGQIVRIEGQAGLGKSHLAAEFAERAINRGFTVSVGACQSTNQEIAYYPWRQVSRALFGFSEQPLKAEDLSVWSQREMARIEERIRDVNPDWLLRMPLLGDMLDLPIPDNPTTAAFDPQLRQEALFALAVEIIQARAQLEPVFLLLEDIHWMDEASRALTLALGRVAGTMPLMVVLVQRPPVDRNRPHIPELNNLPNHHMINLGELSTEGVAALVEHRLQGTVSPLTLSIIQSQAQGNPFFIEELVDALRETRRIYQTENGTWYIQDDLFQALKEGHYLQKEGEEWVLTDNVSMSAVDLGIPDSIHGIVLSRLDRLPEREKLTLKVASVIGRLFEIELLHRSHPVQDDRDALIEQIETLESRDFAHLETPPPRLTYMFKHNVTQEVAYDTLLENQQQELHRMVADRLADLNPEAVEQLAYHYSRSGVRDKTLYYLDKAARKAQHESANETALNYYNQALALEENWEWRRGQIEILNILGHREEEREALEKLSANVATPKFEAAHLWGQYYESVGNYPAAQEAIEQALEISQASRDRLSEMRCYTQFGAIAHKQGDYDRARVFYSQALDLYDEGHSYSDEEARAIVAALNGLGVVHRHQANFEQAQRSHERALAISRQYSDRRGEAQAYNDLGVAAFYHRRFAEALSCHRLALETRRSIGDRAGEGTSLYNLAIATRDTGDYEQAQGYLAAALEILQATGNQWDEVNVRNELGVLYQEMGELAKAQTELEEALEICRTIGDEGGQVYILGNLGLVTRDANDLNAAEDFLSQGLELARKQDDKYVLALFISHLAIVSLRRERFAEAIDRAEQALSMRRELELNLWITADLATLAAAHLAQGNREAARRFADEALSILDECEGVGPENPQQDYFVCYQVLQTLNQPTRAREALRAAHRLVMFRAQKIVDLDLRRSFLQRVHINRQIIDEADQVLWV